MPDLVGLVRDEAVVLKAGCAISISQLWEVQVSGKLAYVLPTLRVYTGRGSKGKAAGVSAAALLLRFLAL